MNIAQLTFIVKTSFNCNMRCAYCYEGHQQNMPCLSRVTVNNLIEKAGHYAKKTRIVVNFVWHGGEPLLMGKKFYEHIVDLQRAFGPDVHFNNMLQTNGLLLSDDLVKFFSEEKFDIGISLDGPEFLHNMQRPACNSSASFQAVNAAIRRTEKSGRGKFSLAVFTRNTLEHLDEFYAFYRDQKLNVRINPLLGIGNATEDKARFLQVTPQEYGRALVHLFDRWISEPDMIFVMEPFFGIVRSLISGQVYSCILAGKCAEFIKVYPNGDLYLCGQQENGAPPLANIDVDALDRVLDSPQRNSYIFDKAAVRETCGDCSHYDVCHGGCTTSASFGSTAKDILVLSEIFAQDPSVTS